MEWFVVGLVVLVVVVKDEIYDALEEHESMGERVVEESRNPMEED